MNTDIPEALIRKFIKGKYVSTELLARELSSALLGPNQVRDVAQKLLCELTDNLPELLGSIIQPLSGPLYLENTSIRDQLVHIVFEYPIQHKIIEAFSFIVSNGLVTFDETIDEAL
jgi:hypothetical protein